MAKKKREEESKPHPVASEKSKDVSLSGRPLSQFIDSIESLTESDIASTSTHQQMLSHWYGRRYATLNKDPHFPWVGSSNINMPLIDAEIDKAKAPLLQILELSPPVSFKALTPKAFDWTDPAEHTMDWLLNTRMRDYKKNVEIGIDAKKMYGYGILKVTYEYQTSVVKETIRRSELTQQNLRDIASLTALLQSGEPIGVDDFGNPVIMTQEDFDIALTEIISERFGLDKEDEIDQKAIEKVMKFVLDDKKDKIEIQRVTVIRDAPYVSPVDPTNFFPEEGVSNIQDCERITELFEDSIQDLHEKAKTGWYDRDAVKAILRHIEKKDKEEFKKGKKSESSTKMTDDLDISRRAREGVRPNAKQKFIRMKQVCCLYDIDGDGVKEKCLLIYHPDSGIRLRFMEYPYEHGFWPYIQLRNEETDGRFYSPRGIPEILDDIDNMITQNHRNKLNAMTIANSPTFKYKMGAHINPDNINWIPGQFYPVVNMNDFEQVNVSVNDFSFDNEENNLRFWTENRLGSFDAAFREQKSEARSATEVGAIIGIQQTAQSTQIARFKRDMKMVLEQVWALWMQYGPSEFTVTLSDNRLFQFSKHELNNKFDIVPVGNISNTNPEAQLARSRQRFGFIVELIQLGLMPVIQEEYDLDVGLAVKDIMDKDDFVASNRIMRKRTPEEIQQIQAQRQAQEQQQGAQQQQQQAVEDNQPLPLGELQASLKQMENQAPNGGAQQVAI